MQKQDGAFYQYALLNLSIMLADFGCLGEALSTMQEAISTARENKDMEYLNHSVSWLLNMSDAHSDGLHGDRFQGSFGIANETMIFLKSKAKETQMWSLLSACLIGEARLRLSRVSESSISCFCLFAYLLQGDDITAALDDITQASHLNVSRSIADGVSSQMALLGSTFSRLGRDFVAFGISV